MMGTTDKDGLTAVLKSTVILDKASEPNNNNKRSRPTKNNKAADKRSKVAVRLLVLSREKQMSTVKQAVVHSQIGAGGKSLPSSDNHSSGSATSKPASAGECTGLANIHTLNFVTEVKGGISSVFV
jgi:hypothetical protein